MNKKSNVAKAQGRKIARGRFRIYLFTCSSVLRSGGAEGKRGLKEKSKKNEYLWKLIIEKGNELAKVVEIDRGDIRKM